MRRGWGSAAIAALAVLSLAGCSEPVPTGAALVGEAKQHYFDYRAVTNDVQALIFDGPWHAEPSSYGMQPSGAGCGDNGYKFDLTRTTSVDPAAQPALSAAVATHLSEAGYSVEGQELGSGTAQSTDVIVRKQGDFSLLMVTFIANGSVLVTADTKCWAGDPNELSKDMFGGVTLANGYFPREESPSDPLFFGVTPGEPAFLSTPKP